MEECEGGWLVTCIGSDTIEFVGGVSRTSLGKWGCENGDLWSPTSVALVPGLGLVLRDSVNRGRFQLFG